MEKESRFLVQKKIWWGKSKKGASDQTQTMLALRANKGYSKLKCTFITVVTSSAFANDDELVSTVTVLPVVDVVEVEVLRC